MGQLKDPATMNQWELDQLEKQARQGLPKKLSYKRTPDPYKEDEDGYYDNKDEEDQNEIDEGYNYEPHMDASIEEAAHRMAAIYGVPVSHNIKIKSQGNRHFYEEEAQEDVREDREELAYMRDEHRVESTYRPRAPRGLNFTRRKIS